VCVCVCVCVFAIFQMVASYSCKRKTNRWPMVVFSTILDVSAVNDFVVWREVNPSWERGKNFKRRLFLEELGKALVSPHMERRKSMPHAPASAEMVKRKQDASDAPGPSTETSSFKRKRCQVCPRIQKRISSAQNAKEPFVLLTQCSCDRSAWTDFCS